MHTSSRLYHCCRCHAQIIICRACDRGQRYCAKRCSQNARKASLQRAGKKYQASRAGRFNNAARQQRFRQRKKQKVTHHRSPQITPCAVLKNRPNWPKDDANQAKTAAALHCHHCGAVCEPFLRHDFLHRSHFKRALRRH